MSAVLESTGALTYRLGEFHAFESAGQRFLYLVPSGAIFALDETGRHVVDRLAEGACSGADLTASLHQEGHQEAQIESALAELEIAGVVECGRSGTVRPAVPETAFPLQRIVLNVTNQCNLACAYCYEYSADKITHTEGKPKYMSGETARASIDLLLRESAERPSIHVTFFGGETLLNFPLLQSTVQYAKEKCAEAGKRVEFSLTTNATLLDEEIIDFLAEHRVGVTVSIDGDRELNDRMRVFHDGRGSYDAIVPRIRLLLARHRTNSIGARVTLSSGVSHVRRIFDHLTQEVGFKAVGFSPATANPERLYHIGPARMDSVLGGFEELAWEYRDCALEGKAHGFTNANDTLKDLHSGISKAYACGAGLGLLGVGTAGDLSLCHRFVDSPVGKMGHVHAEGVDQDARSAFLQTHHLGARVDCHTCWARPVCSGGCYHEAFIHYGDTAAANLHYCDWIRGWNDLCLRIYGEIGVRNPSFLNRFNDN